MKIGGAQYDCTCAKAMKWKRIDKKKNHQPNSQFLNKRKQFPNHQIFQAERDNTEEDRPLQFEWNKNPFE